VRGGQGAGAARAALSRERGSGKTTLLEVLGRVGGVGRLA
jgi:hypothetical protein